MSFYTRPFIDAMNKQVTDLGEFEGKTIESIKSYLSEWRIKFTDGTFAIVEADRDGDGAAYLDLSHYADEFTLIGFGLASYSQQIEEARARIQDEEQRVKEREYGEYLRLKKKFETEL